MCHMQHPCFTLSVILCIGAAYGHWEDYTPKPVVRESLKEFLRGTKAWYSRKLEVKVADDISSYALRYNLKKPGDVTELLRFVNDFEMAFYYKAIYFKSKRQLFKQIIHAEGKVGCAHLPHYPRGYICLIEVPWGNF
ncbi:unnamed protein product [Cylicocyclus nassatus]|uniref:Secreted protein n=1 Tax=Cylicocyclus nassatus TaxID=53992 RepID=A0AA36DRW0_CYLNA|nr:unnamed protein product [Cylicocyclus nassatus]